MTEARSASRVHGSPDNTASGQVLGRVLAGEDAYEALCDASQVDRIRMVKLGVPARLLVNLASDMQVTRERLYGWLGIARATANRKVKADDVLSQDESERALGIARLVGQVERVVSESGSAEGFDAAQWTAAWLQRKNPALGGLMPGEFMDTAEGRVLVAGLIDQMQTGAYA